MLGSVFLGFPQTQDFVSSLTSASLKEPVAGGSPPPTSPSWQSDEHQKPYRSTKKPVVLKKLTSQWSWKEGKRAAWPWLLWIQMLWPACSQLAAVLQPQGWGPVLVLLAAVVHTLLYPETLFFLLLVLFLLPQSFSSSLVCHLPQRTPLKATPRPPHPASVELPICMIMIVCWIAVFPNALSDSGLWPWLAQWPSLVNAGETN